MGEDRKEIHVKEFPTETWRRFRSRAALLGVNVNMLLAFVVGEWLDTQDKESKEAQKS